MTSSDRSDVIYPTTQLYNDTATCYNNKLTSLIYDEVRAVDWKQAKTLMEGPTQSTGRRIIGQVAGHKINLEIEGVQAEIKQDRYGPVSRLL